MNITVSITDAGTENQAAIDELRGDTPASEWAQTVLAGVIEDMRLRRLRRRVAELGAAIEAAPYETRMAIDAQIQAAIGAPS